MRKKSLIKKFYFENLRSPCADFAPFVLSVIVLEWLSTVINATQLVVRTTEVSFVQHVLVENSPLGSFSTVYIIYEFFSNALWAFVFLNKNL